MRTNCFRKTVFVRVNLKNIRIIFTFNFLRLTSVFVSFQFQYKSRIFQRITRDLGMICSEQFPDKFDFFTSHFHFNLYLKWIISLISYILSLWNLFETERWPMGIFIYSKTCFISSSLVYLRSLISDRIKNQQLQLEYQVDFLCWQLDIWFG